MSQKKIAFLRNKYPKIDDKTFNLIVYADPTMSKLEYGDWLCRMYSSGGIANEDELNKTCAILSLFHQFKNKIPANRRDIGQYKSLLDLSWVVNLEVVKVVNNNQSDSVFAKIGAKRTYEDSRWLVIMPRTIEASIKYGKGTQWCTSSVNSRSTFYNYMGNGDIYVIIDKNYKQTGSKPSANSKYQIHLQENGHNLEFRNARNTEVKLGSFFNEHKELFEYFCSIEAFSNSIIKDPQFIFLIDKPTIAQQMAALEHDPLNIRYIKKPHSTVQVKAIKYDIKTFDLIEDPSREAQVEYVSHSGKYLKNLYDRGIEPNEKIQSIAVSDYPLALKWIDNPSAKVKSSAVISDGAIIKFIKNPSDAIQIEAVKSNPHAIKYIKKPCDRAQIIAIESVPAFIKHLKNPPRKAQLLAVKHDGKLIEYIDNPTEKMWIIAITDESRLFNKKSNPSKKLVVEVAKSNPNILKYKKARGLIDKEDIIEIIKQEPEAIQFIPNPTGDIQEIAVKKDYGVLDLIKKPTKKAYEIAKKKREKYEASKEKLLDDDYFGRGWSRVMDDYANHYYPTHMHPMIDKIEESSYDGFVVHTKDGVRIPVPDHGALMSLLDYFKRMYLKEITRRERLSGSIDDNEWGY